jgi:hypothetical protein
MSCLHSAHVIEDVMRDFVQQHGGDDHVEHFIAQPCARLSLSVSWSAPSHRPRFSAA